MKNSMKNVMKILVFVVEILPRVVELLASLKKTPPPPPPPAEHDVTIEDV